MFSRELLIYEITLGLCSISAICFWLLVRKNIRTVQFTPQLEPSPVLKSAFLLAAYLTGCFAFEVFAVYKMKQHEYNFFVYAIYFTVCLPVLFSFYSLHLTRVWKKMLLIPLYGTVIGLLLYQNSYNKRSVLTPTFSITLDVVCFIAALIFISDILIQPKRQQFNFLLKIGIAFLIFNFLSSMMTSIIQFDVEFPEDQRALFFYLHLYMAMSFYALIGVIFWIEFMNLRKQIRHG